MMRSHSLPQIDFRLGEALQKSLPEEFCGFGKNLIFFPDDIQPGVGARDSEKGCSCGQCKVDTRRSETDLCKGARGTFIKARGNDSGGAGSGTFAAR